MTPVIIELPGDPVVKGRARTALGAVGIRHYPHKATEAYETALKHLGKIAMRGQPLLVGALSMTVTSYFVPPRSWSRKKRATAAAGLIRPTAGSRFDWDNLGKIASDALNGIVYADDAQIVDGRSIKFYSDRPRLKVVVAPIAPGRTVA